MRLGIICPSEIAFRRFLPALKKTNIEYVGVAYASLKEWFGDNVNDSSSAIIENEHNKADNFKHTYGGKVFNGYDAMLTSGEIDAVYLPLPPALHYKWAKRALENGLHVLAEKPFTTSMADTEELIRLANEKELALHENYMFVFHSQIETINRVVQSGAIGEVRLFRIDFGFPDRGKSDFRYNKALGGGALLDCGGYTLRYANILLGGNAKLSTANLLYTDKYNVEVAGSATLINDKRQVAQVSFGMDNDYRCSVDIWGSLGSLRSGRVLTAPDGFVPTYEITKNGQTESFKMQSDDAFYNSLAHFIYCIEKKHERMDNYRIILKQASLVNLFKINFRDYDRTNLYTI